MLKKMGAVFLLSLCSAAFAGGCPTAKQREGLLTFEVVASPKNTMLRLPISVVGEAEYQTATRHFVPPKGCLRYPIAPIGAR